MSEVGAVQQFSMRVDPGLAGRRIRFQLRDRLTFELVNLALGVALVIVGAVSQWLFLLLVGAAMLAIVVYRMGRSVWTERRYVHVMHPVGSTITAEYGADQLVVRDSMCEGLNPYAEIASVQTRGDFVEVVLKHQPRFLIPAEICPPGIVERLAASVESAAPATVPATFTHVVRTTDAYAKAIAAYSVRRGVLSPVWLISIVVCVTVGIAMVSTGRWIEAALVLSPLVLLVLAVVSRLQSWPSQAGIQMRTRFDDDGFMFSDSHSAAKWAYDVCDRVKLRPLAVELRWKDGVWGQYPRELFPDAELARFVKAGAPVS